MLESVISSLALLFDQLHAGQSVGAALLFELSRGSEDGCMNKWKHSLLLSGMCLLLSAAALSQGPTSASDTARADQLLRGMTTEEKIGQLNQPFYFKLPIAWREGRSGAV